MESTKDVTSCIPSEKNSLLIAEVKKFPSLYDTSDPNYYALAERNKAWLQVAENCNEQAELCHLRWKSLRKRFAKEKRRFPEILQGKRRPWALFPKMSFLTPATAKRKLPVKGRRRSAPNSLTSASVEFKQNPSDDDMLIVDDNDEIVHTCKSTEMSEEDEYIYETLDDPDSALEIMKEKPSPQTKATAIRSGNPAVPQVARYGGSGRIRKVTPKMQNSIIAKKLKQAQQVLQHTPKNNSPKTAGPLKVTIVHNKPAPVNNMTVEKSVLYQDQTMRHIATVNPNIIRLEKANAKESRPITNTQEDDNAEASKSESESKAFKVVKLKGRNPIIFSPEQLPDIQSFLKSEAETNKDESTKKSILKVKSVDHLNSQSSSTSSTDTGDNNMDIIHSLGLMRKSTPEKTMAAEKASNQSYSRSYSWNRPVAKAVNKQQTATEKIQPDSQTNDYEIEETWNDIKEENIEDVMAWPHPPGLETPTRQQTGVQYHQATESLNRANIWNQVNEAKLELVAFQRKLLEEQHRKNLEYMKKEHELKMTLLKAEIDLKRKQLNIML